MGIRYNPNLNDEIEYKENSKKDKDTKRSTSTTCHNTSDYSKPNGYHTEEKIIKYLKD